jgi:hypothetical protein
LHPTTRGNCNDPRTIGTATGSSAVIKKNADNTVSAQVSLKNALPNAIYEVVLVQTPSGSNCFLTAGIIRTNTQGNGNERVSAPLTPGDTGAFVAVFGGDLSGSSDLQQTANQVFGTK